MSTQKLTKTEDETGCLVKAAQRGATLVEYALLVSLIAIVVITATRALGQGTSTHFSSIEAPISGGP